MEETKKDKLYDKLLMVSTNKFDTIMKVNNYSIDDFTIFFENIKDDEKDKVFEELINKIVFDLKKISTPSSIGESIINYNIIMDHFILYDYDANRVLDDILLKLAGCHKEISIPINIKELKDNYFNHRKNDKTIYQSFMWILLGIIAVNYYIKYKK